MHPLIRQFPSEHFYEGRLKDGKNITTQTMTKEYHSHLIFRPFVFFDVKNTFETKAESTHSLKNVKEAKFCALLVKNFFQLFSSKLAVSKETPHMMLLALLRNVSIIIDECYF
jgi:senataxin